MSVTGEVGSLAELAGALQDEGSTLVRLFGSDMEMLVTGLGEGGGEPAGNTKPETDAQRKKREKQEAKAASEAKRAEATPPAAPAPAPIPPAPGATDAAPPPAPPAPAASLPADPPAPPPAPVPPELAKQNADAAANGSIPAYLKVQAAPPPPPAPPAPPVPPSGVLAGKLIPHMEGIAAQQADGGQAYANWLAEAGIVVKGATFAEAMAVIRMQPDEKLKPIADALKIAA